MDYLQYNNIKENKTFTDNGFKPCYKWITFNTEIWSRVKSTIVSVLNLVINGLPSIQITKTDKMVQNIKSFKPCYKWITFNTLPKV